MKRTITLLLLFITLQMSAQCWQSIDAGYDHSLAVKNDGTIWAWGSNGTGCLGDNTIIDKIIPTQIGTANNWLQVCASFNSSYAIKSNGTLWAWGTNYAGRLGLGTTTPVYLVPTQVGTDNNWQSISSFDDFCLALKTDGTLWAWGDNANGKLGLGTTTTVYLVPTQVGVATNWQKVSGGYSHSLSVKNNGTLWAWGSNSNGQFGVATPSSSNIPFQIGTDTDWQDVSTGHWLSYAIKTNKTLWSTGINGSGQLGNGTFSSTDVYVFTQVGTSSDSEKIATGYYHVLNTNQDGFIRVTGYNNKGQLGDGTTASKNTLTYISCYPTVLATEDFTINELKTYPNPVKDILNFSLDKEITTVSIYNLLGQEVVSKSVNNNDVSIDVAGLTAGTYLVKVTSNNEVKTVKVFKN